MSDPFPTRFLQRPLASWIVALLLGVSLLLAYSNSFHGPFIFDDIPSIVENPTIRNFGTALFPPSDSSSTVSGRPILNLSLAVNYKIGGLNTTGYHAVNLFIHFCATLALFGVLRRTLKLPGLRERFGPSADWFAFSIAALWSLHPIQTESVTYVVQRTESLVGLFYLLVLYGFVRSTENPSSQRMLWQLLSIAACAVGMATKEVMVSAPLIVLLFDRAFGSNSFRAAWKNHRSYHCATATSWIVLAICMRTSGDREGGIGFGLEVSSFNYLLTQCEAITHYLRVVFWPSSLVLDHGRKFVSDWTEVAAQGAVLLTLGISAVWALWKKPRLGFLAAMFFIVLAPTSSVVPIADPIFEHRMYLALAAVVSLVVVGSARFLGTRILALWLVIAVALGTVSHRRNHDYRSAEAIWADSSAKRPENERAWFSLGHILLDQSRFAEARDAFARGLAAKPDSPALMIDYANALVKTGDASQNPGTLYRTAIDKLRPEHPLRYQALNNLGAFLIKNGQAEEAVERLREAIELRPTVADARFTLSTALISLGRFDDAVKQLQLILSTNPEWEAVRLSLGEALTKLGRTDEALDVLRAGLPFSTQPAELHINQGAALVAAGRIVEGKQQFEAALRIDPGSIQARVSLGFALLNMQDTAGAVTQFDTAAKLNPRDPLLQVALARALLTLGRQDESFAHFETAVSIAPEDLQIRYSYAHVLLEAGRNAEAVHHYNELLRAAPTSPQIHHELGIAYARLYQRETALKHLREALRLQPDFPEARESLKRFFP